jgi:hypothetical protein
MVERRLNPDFRQLCVEAERMWYYGRHDGLAVVMRKISDALTATAPAQPLNNGG